MSDFNRAGSMVLQSVKNIIKDHGFFTKDEFPEQGQIAIQNSKGRVIFVNLLHLVEYYYKTQDEHAVSSFVLSLIGAIEVERRFSWADDQYNVFPALHPMDAVIKPDFSQSLTHYCGRFFVLTMPQKSVWVTSTMLQEWGVGHITLERQAYENANGLLNTTEVILTEVQGCPVGSFAQPEQGLNAALLLAPSLKERVQDTFGWPLYAVIPNKNSCIFFRKNDFNSLKRFIKTKIQHDYEDLHRISPELLELNNWGISSYSSLHIS